MAEVMSPIVSQRIWALPVSAAAVKFLQYLLYRSEFGGQLPVRQKDMAREYGITPQAVSLLMAPLSDLNIVLRPRHEGGRQGSSYRLHPFAAKYESHEALEQAVRHTLGEIKAGRMPNLKLPAFAVMPPAEGKPKLHVA
ncbi:hypothetical protein ACFQ69_34620 [Streptomyces sp. NPDC056470]|uniref:hypothetical protein n=1 Tax=Streptomyces sp. NPDC056470 TaxID=3345831 RepID=UPI0036B51720